MNTNYSKPQVTIDLDEYLELKRKSKGIRLPELDLLRDTRVSDAEVNNLLQRVRTELSDTIYLHELSPRYKPGFQWPWSKPEIVDYEMYIKKEDDRIAFIAVNGTVGTRSSRKTVVDYFTNLLENKEYYLSKINSKP